MFSKPNTLIYLQRASLMLAGKRLAGARLDMPEDVIRNLELQDRPKFISLVEQFLRDRNILGRRILLVLDGSVMFHKVIELDKSGQPDLLIKGFVDAMPFEPGKRACLAVQTDTHLRLFAANADLYNAVAEAIHASGAGKLVSITPAAAYNLPSATRSIGDAADKFFGDKNVRKLADFRTVAPA